MVVQLLCICFVRLAVLLRFCFSGGCKLLFAVWDFVAMCV